MIKSFKDITILKFQEIQAAIAMNPDNEFEQWYNILSLVDGQDKDYYKFKLKFGEFKKKIEEYLWIMSEKMPDEWVKDFTVEGERFFVQQHATEWNGEQLISMINLTKDKDQIINNTHLILATLCLKEPREVVDLHEFERRAKMFQEKLCILTAYPISFFFALFLAKLSTDTRYSWALEKWMKNKQNQTHSTKHGAGIT